MGSINIFKPLPTVLNAEPVINLSNIFWMNNLGIAVNQTRGS